MNSKSNRTPRNYQGTGLTTHCMGDLLAAALAGISSTMEDRPDLILAAWPDIIGKPLAGMTQAVSFHGGVLTIKVKNSSLHNILSQHDKPRIIQALRRKFPKITISNVIFRIG